jgi:hypothetical protein
VIHRLHFKVGLDAYAEARAEGGKWIGTVNGEESIRVESDSADGALRLANAAYVRLAADRIEKGERL